MKRILLALAAIGAIAASLGNMPVASADDGQGVRTQSGKMRCLVYANDTYHGGGPLVVCQRGDGGSPFPQAPMSAEYNEQMNLATVKGNGALSWNIGNIPGSPEAEAQDIVLAYNQPYHVNGWTVLPSFDGTRFANDRTGHGMFVTFDNVATF